ncbi:trypsin-1-like [Xylocopa sonorina]|uniref:trypsin-1-like n=1 Tax=Xylocopa sonorina TaxID=1818115 RepID=UPI00403B1B5C
MSLKLIAFATLLTAVTAAKPYHEDLSSSRMDVRIVGGKEALQGQYPWQVSLQWGESASSTTHICGGSILSDVWVLTSGLCAKEVPNYGTFLVKAGKHNLKRIEMSEQSVRVEKSIVHEKYTGGVGPYDIALLRLETPLRLNNLVKAISLPREGNSPSGTAILTGWGATSKTSTTVMSDKLQEAQLPLIDLDTCELAIERLIGSSPLDQTNICTGPLSGGYAACNGDAGGPLILHNGGGNTELIGIVSWGIVPCGIVGAPSVYTKVSAFDDWILDTIANN